MKKCNTYAPPNLEGIPSNQTSQLSTSQSTTSIQSNLSTGTPEPTATPTTPTPTPPPPPPQTTDSSIVTSIPSNQTSQLSTSQSTTSIQSNLSTGTPEPTATPTTPTPTPPPPPPQTTDSSIVTSIPSNQTSQLSTSQSTTSIQSNLSTGTPEPTATPTTPTPTPPPPPPQTTDSSIVTSIPSNQTSQLSTSQSTTSIQSNLSTGTPEPTATPTTPTPTPPPPPPQTTDSSIVTNTTGTISQGSTNTSSDNLLTLSSTVDHTPTIFTDNQTSLTSVSLSQSTESITTTPIPTNTTTASIVISNTTTATFNESSTHTSIDNVLVSTTSATQFNTSTAKSTILTTEVTTNKLIEITSTLIDQSTQFITNLLTNATTLTTIATTTTTTTTTVYIGRVTTVFQIKAVLYATSTGKNVPWSNDYADKTSNAYKTLSTSYCSLLLNSLLTENAQITQGATCKSIEFTRIILSSLSKRQVQSSNNATTDAVQGNAQIELQTLTGSQLNQAQFSQLLLNGYQKLNLTSGNFLNNIQSTRISPTITCSQTRSLCGEHASCRNTDNGVTCTCDPMWKDVTPEDPGKNCTLHPGTIALIVFAALLLAAAIGALIYFLVRTESIKKLRLKQITAN
ncbi:unnamed protein product [Schistosoma turkestanicum]|nr:unnamed protein product [Schistosoma turkestanicum]